ncbi:hypothetical protein KKA95_03895, partial [Patescibacteria group bacterium]|nr:hypothetical protein [Patescibacteria group bacterium]
EIMEFADTNGEYLDPDLLAQVLKAYMRDGILQALSARTKSNDKIIKVKLTDIGKELAEKNRDAVTEILATRMTETD